MGQIVSFRDRALQSRDAIDLLESKWRITVIHLLRDGPLRTVELQEAVPEVSPKVLTETLRGMERDGLLRRDVHQVLPPHVEYTLTDMGHSLIPPLQQLCQWAKAHARERDAAREAFDQRTPAPPSRRQNVRRSPRP